MTQTDIHNPSGQMKALRQMLLSRAFEDTVRDQFADGEIPGFVHLSQGQEATAVGTCAALTDDDYITSTHRAHGHSIAKGLEPKRLLAELYGKGTGYCSGKGGSMHVAHLEKGMLGAQPIVGASVPLATGAGITAQHTDADWIGLAFIGDGAVAEGQVHEAFNLAATWDLPVVFMIENNLYSEGMRYDEQHNIDELAEMAAAYGIPGEIIDGQDVEEVYETVVDARAQAIDGKGPTLIEAKTYRYRGHFEGDQQPYRPADEVEEWRETRDPITTYADQLLDDDVLTTDEYDELETEVTEVIDDALKFARDSDPAADDTAYDHIFAESVPEITNHRERMVRKEADWGVEF